jgi:hypothetical protein
VYPDPRGLDIRYTSTHPSYRWESSANRLDNRGCEPQNTNRVSCVRLVCIGNTNGRGGFGEGLPVKASLVESKRRGTANPIHCIHRVYAVYHCIHTVYTRYTHGIPLYTHCIHIVYTPYTHRIHTVYTPYTLGIHTVYTRYTYRIHSVYTAYRVYAIHTLYG